MATTATNAQLKLNGSVLVGVMNITAPAIEVSEVDVTVLASTSKEFIPSIPDGGTCSFEILYTDATYSALRAVHGITQTWAVVFPDAEEIEFDAFTTKLEIELAGGEDAVVIKGEMKVTGDVS